MLFKLLGVNPNGYNRFAVLLAIAAFGFVSTFIMFHFLRQYLPADAGRAFAVNGEKSKGKPRGAGIIFVLVFAVLSALFLPVGFEDLVYLGAIVLAMLTGFLDDASEKPWNEYKKGLLDFLIAGAVTFTYIWHNGPVFRLAFFRTEFQPKTVELPVWLFAILSVALIWIAINVVNCTDGVDGLSGSLSVISAGSFLFAVPLLRTNTEVAFGDSMSGANYSSASELLSDSAAGYEVRYQPMKTLLKTPSDAIPEEMLIGLGVILIGCLLAYLWFNCSPSILMMGDAGSRALGLFFALMALRTDPFLFLPFCLVFILDGGLGLVKVSLKRFLKISIMKNIRTPIHDHVRKKSGWSDAQTVYRFVMVQSVISAVFFLIAFWVR